MTNSSVLTKENAKNETHGKHNEKAMTFCVYVLCLICAILYSISSSALIGYFSAFCVLLFILQKDEEESFYLILGLQFVQILLSVEIGSGNYSFLVFAYLAIFLKQIIRGRKITFIACLPLMLFVWDVCVCVIEGQSSIASNFLWVGSFIYVIHILLNKAKQIDFSRLIIYFLLAQWTICLVNIIAEYITLGSSLNPTMYGAYNDIYGYFAFGVAYGGVAGGNAISLNNAMAIALCILEFKHANTVVKKAFYIVSVLFFSYTGMLIVSRSFYVEIAMFLALFIISKMKKPKDFLIAIIIVASVGFIFSKFFQSSVDVLLDLVEARFAKGNSDRTQLINESQNLLSNNFRILLIGAGSFYPNVYGFTAHNHYLDSILSLGILGGLIYWGIILYLIMISIKKAKEYSKLRFQSFIPMLMLLAHRYVSGSTRDVIFYFYIFIVLAYLIWDTRSQKNE